MFIIVILKILYFFIEDILYYFIRNILKWVVLVVISCSALFYFYIANVPEVINYKNIIISKNTSFNTLTNQFFKQGIIKNKTLFKYAAIYLKYDKNVKSGEFNIPSNLNEYQLVKEIIELTPIQRKVTIIEGLKYSEIIPIIAEKMDLDINILNHLFSNESLLKKYNIKADNLEGYIFPQTYNFTWGMTESDIVDYLISQMMKEAYSIYTSIDKPKYTFHEYLILASIIDAESNFPDEMPMVSSVYHNRLDKGWKLQADPTIIYILGKAQRVLFRHLKIDNPYNTYMYPGLPKGPINNPGIDAIKAAFHPKKSNYMYFTGTGDGTGRHLFARSLKQHNKNRSQLDAARRNKKK